MEKKATVTKDELAFLISRRVPGVNRTAVKTIIDLLVMEIVNNVADGRRIQLTGLGSWTPKKKAARTGRNPHTNEIVTIPARYYPVYSPSESFKKVVAENLKGRRL